MIDGDSRLEKGCAAFTDLSREVKIELQTPLLPALPAKLVLNNRNNILILRIEISMVSEMVVFKKDHTPLTAKM